MKESHYIIGTAGHIDHGKTALVKALTGVNTDRLEEEKKRGLTIELGFTSLILPSGEKIGLVDTPGHEKFIRTMVSGATGMDLVLLVISAKEGIMPQTREHLSILHLLKVKKIVVALTMIDLVDSFTVEKREEEIRELFHLMEIDPGGKLIIFPLSSFTGEGVDKLAAFLAEESKKIEGKSPKGFFRMPIDRAFSVSGAGTIVTGTALSGSVLKGVETKNKEETAVDEEDRRKPSVANAARYMIYPEEKDLKIRNIQVHGENQDRAYAGERIALNLQGIGKEDCHKGDVIGESGLLHPTDLLDCRVKTVFASGQEIKHNQHLELLIGTAHIPCKIVFLEKDRIKDGESALCQLQLDGKTVAVHGDPFILRHETVQRTVGGGAVLDPNPAAKHRRGRFSLEHLLALEKEGEEALLYAFLRKQKRRFTPLSILKKQFAGFSKVQECIQEMEEGKETEAVFVIEQNQEFYCIAKSFEEELEEKLQSYLLDFYRKNPYKLGEKTMVLYSKLFSSFTKPLYRALLKQWDKEGRFVLGGDFLQLPGHKVLKDARYTLIANALVNDMQKAKYNFMKLSDHFWLPEEKKVLPDVLDNLVEKGTIVPLFEEYYTLRKIFASLKDFSLQKIEEDGEITIDALREEFGISRKNAKLFFKAMDRMELTKDRGFESARSAP